MLVVAALIASVVVVFASVVCFTLREAAASGGLPRNSAIGIRTAKTEISGESWGIAAPILKKWESLR